MLATTYTLEQLRINSYQILVLDPGIDNGANNYQDLTNLCTSIQWDYDLDQACEKYTLTFVKSAGLVDILKPLSHIIINAIQVWANIEVGEKLEPLKYGVIIDTDLASTSKGQVQITAYDIMWYVSTNKSSHALQAETATSFIQRICHKYNIPMGFFADTKTVIGPSTFLERTLWDMFVSTLALTRDVAYKNVLVAQGNSLATAAPIAPQYQSERYYLRTYFNTIALVKKEDPSFAWLFESKNLFTAAAKWSAQNYRNYVQVFDRKTTDDTAAFDVMAVSSAAPGGDISPTGWYPKDITKDPDIKKYGLLAESVTLVGAADPSLAQLDPATQADYQAQQLLVRLRKILHTATISTLNINTLGPGDAIFINEPITGLTGKYYVKSGSHKVTAKDSTMNLTLNLEDLLPEAYKNVPETASPLVIGVMDK
jgi:hypothetical protein